MTDKNKYTNYTITGKKGGGGSVSQQRVPVEAENNLFSNSVLHIVDALCEGEIEGPAINDSWAESTYFNEIPYYSDAKANYAGVTIEARVGEPDQAHLTGFSNITTSFVVNTDVTAGGGAISRTVTDGDVDDVTVTIYVPQLMKTDDEDGDIKKTGVVGTVTVTPENGAGSEFTAINWTIYGKNTSPFERQYLIDDIAQYGNAPWIIKVYRTTADSSTARLVNSTYWKSYNEIINEKMIYPDTVVVGTKIDAKLFGTQVPARAWKIKGLKVKYPSNYNPTTNAYTGDWNGNFSTGWTDNPAWVLYDVIINKRYGLGISEDYVDKWSFYNAAVYNDGLVPYTEKAQQADGSYTSTPGTQRRFTFNGVISDRVDAYYLLNHLASSFRSYVLWSAGSLTVVQDSPTDVSATVTNANVIDGMFNYEGTAMKQRHTVALVSWNDPDDFSKATTDVIVDDEGIQRYGWNQLEINAIACNSRYQAIRIGRWALDTEKNATEIVTYKCGLDHADVAPGEVVAIADNHYAAEQIGGRYNNATTTSIDTDRTVTINGGETYTLFMQTSSGTISEKTLNNGAGDTTTLTWASALSYAPDDGLVWVLSATDLAARQFRVIDSREIEAGTFEIRGVLYDSTKYARVELGIIADTPQTSRVNSGVLEPPTNLTVEEYTYIQGGSNNHYFGAMIGWINSTDPRTDFYQIRVKPSTGAYYELGTTAESSYDWKPVVSGTYNVGVRGVGTTGFSEWVTYSNYSSYNTISGVAAPTGLQVRGDGTTWSGTDCEIEWTGSIGAVFGELAIGTSVVKDYVVKVYRTTPLETLLRTDYTTDTNYTYTYGMNVIDNKQLGYSGAIRALKFSVWTRSIYDDLSSTAISATMTNPAPDMAGTEPTITPIYLGLKIDWSTISPNDNDGSHYKIYCDTNTPPTTVITQLSWDTDYWVETGLSSADGYYVQIEPYDRFGAGTKTDIPSIEYPLKVGEIDIDAELTQSITITDDQSTSSGTLEELYDKIKDSGGPSYTLSGDTGYANYNFGIEYFIDRVAVYVAGAAKVYVAYKRLDGSWNWLKAEADHTLDASGELDVATNQADCQTNYWLLESGRNTAIFPQGIIALDCRLYIYDTNVQVYEIVFGREVIAEFVVADNVAAISADLGAISAGTLQSTNYDADEGMFFDFDGDAFKLGGNDDPQMEWNGTAETFTIGQNAGPKFEFDGNAGTLNIEAVVTFESTSAGYANISDKPTNLAGINATEGGKLTGIATGADVTSANVAASIASQGALATKASVDLATGEVTNKSLANIADSVSYIRTPILWKKTGKTTIDGGQLETDSVVAGAISVTNLAAISANMGSITAGSISASLITAGFISADRIQAGSIITSKVANSAITTSTRVTGVDAFWSSSSTNAINATELTVTIAAANYILLAFSWDATIQVTDLMIYRKINAGAYALLEKNYPRAYLDYYGSAATLYYKIYCTNNGGTVGSTVTNIDFSAVLLKK